MTQEYLDWLNGKYSEPPTSPPRPQPLSFEPEGYRGLSAVSSSPRELHLNPKEVETLRKIQNQQLDKLAYLESKYKFDSRQATFIETLDKKIKTQSPEKVLNYIKNTRLKKDPVQYQKILNSFFKTNDPNKVTAAQIEDYKQNQSKFDQKKSKFMFDNKMRRDITYTRHTNVKERYASHLENAEFDKKKARRVRKLKQGSWGEIENRAGKNRLRSARFVAHGGMLFATASGVTSLNILWGRDGRSDTQKGRLNTFEKMYHWTNVVYSGSLVARTVASMPSLKVPLIPALMAFRESLRHVRSNNAEEKTFKSLAKKLNRAKYGLIPNKKRLQETIKLLKNEEILAKKITEGFHSIAADENLNRVQKSRARMTLAKSIMRDYGQDRALINRVVDGSRKITLAERFWYGVTRGNKVAQAIRQGTRYTVQGIRQIPRVVGNSLLKVASKIGKIAPVLGKVLKPVATFVQKVSPALKVIGKKVPFVSTALYAFDIGSSWNKKKDGSYVLDKDHLTRAVTGLVVNTAATVVIGSALSAIGAAGLVGAAAFAAPAVAVIAIGAAAYFATKYLSKFFNKMRRSGSSKTTEKTDNSPENTNEAGDKDMSNTNTNDSADNTADTSQTVDTSQQNSPAIKGMIGNNKNIETKPPAKEVITIVPTEFVADSLQK